MALNKWLKLTLSFILNVNSHASRDCHLLKIWFISIKVTLLRPEVSYKISQIYWQIKGLIYYIERY